VSTKHQDFGVLGYQRKSDWLMLVDDGI